MDGAGALAAANAHARVSEGVARIGVSTDLSNLYTDPTGTGSVHAARMTVEDFRAERKGLKVEVVDADYLSNSDADSTTARRWWLPLGQVTPQ